MRRGGVCARSVYGHSPGHPWFLTLEVSITVMLILEILLRLVVLRKVRERATDRACLFGRSCPLAGGLCYSRARVYVVTV